MDTMDAPAQDAAGEAPGTGGERRGITFEVIAIIAFFLALAAAILAVFAMALATRSIDEVRNAPAGGGGGGGGVTVTLSEFAISPAPLSAAQDSVLTVSNSGNVAHDLTVEGIATPEIAAGDSAQLDLTGLEPGTYDIYCQIAGHRESGMETEITIG